MSSTGHRDDGFTLIETLVVVAILGVLVTIAVASYVAATGRARDVTCRNNQQTLERAIPIYAAQNNAMPDDLEDLRPFVTDFDTTRLCPDHDGTELVYDPVTRRVTCPNHP